MLRISSLTRKREAPTKANGIFRICVLILASIGLYNTTFSIWESNVLSATRNSKTKFVQLLSSLIMDSMSIDRYLQYSRSRMHAQITAKLPLEVKKLKDAVLEVETAIKASDKIMGQGDFIESNSEVKESMEKVNSLVRSLESTTAFERDDDFIGKQFVASFTSRNNNSLASDLHPAKKKLLLIWGDYYTSGTPPFLRNFTFDHCQVSHCEWTQNKSSFQEADALWFHLVHYPPEEFKFVHPPPRPSPRQVWIASSQEWESLKCSEAELLWDDYFNWTMSYKMDSDVWWPYGVAVRTPLELRKPNALWDRQIGAIFERKSRSVMFVSHKQRVVESQRTEYVRQLSKYIDVDFYGGNISSPWLPNWKLYSMLSNKYKFVIAFENALCKDYISEKFWKIGLMHEAIPIVRNGLTKDDIEKVAPLGSYINARDFKNPKELAAYLHVVASNKTLYESYFQWKKKYTLKYDFRGDIRATFEMASGDAVNSWCKVCEKLHDTKMGSKTVKFSGNWCFEERGPENYATHYSQCSKAVDLE